MVKCNRGKSILPFTHEMVKPVNYDTLLICNVIPKEKTKTLYEKKKHMLKDTTEKLSGILKEIQVTQKYEENRNE